jgi:hypothetical protein
MQKGVNVNPLHERGRRGGPYFFFLGAAFFVAFLATFFFAGIVFFPSQESEARSAGLAVRPRNWGVINVHPPLPRARYFFFFAAFFAAFFLAGMV